MKLFTVVALLLCIVSTYAADREHQVKAEFIYKLSKYIEWPKGALGSPGSQFVVGVIGQDAYGRDLDDALAGTTIDGHPVALRRLQSESAVTDCRIVVTGSSDPERIAHLARLCKGTGTILIGDAPDFAKNGGTIGFLIESNHIRFDVNLDTARKAEVSINLKLLGLARTVYRG